MRRALTSILALLMIANVFTAYAFIPALIAGAVAIGSGIGLGLWLGHEWWGKPADQKIKELEQQLTQEKLENLATLESASLNSWSKSKVIVYDLGDAVHYGRNYAWALAKYEIIKALEQGDTLDAAASKARFAVFRYYLNVTKNIIEEANNTAKYLNFTLNRYAVESGSGGYDHLCLRFRIYLVYDDKWYANSCKIGVNKSYHYSYINGHSFKLVWYKPFLVLKVERLNVLGKTFKVLKIVPNVKLAKVHLVSDFTPLNLVFRDVSGHTTEVYDFGKYKQVLSQINREYQMIIKNINAYVNGLKNSQFNTTDLIDPYVLATFLDKDWDKTGYYGYAAAELALLGLNTPGLNYTVTIKMNGQNMSGFLFTDWTGTLEVGKSYTANSNHIWYLITTDQNGQTLLVPLHGTFMVEDLRDWQGHKINSTTLTNYDPHSGDVQKIYEELKKIEGLYEQYLNNLQPVASGSSFNLSKWWNGLDTYAKIGVIAIACVMIYAIFRRG